MSHAGALVSGLLIVASGHAKDIGANSQSGASADDIGKFTNQNAGSDISKPSISIHSKFLMTLEPSSMQQHTKSSSALVEDAGISQVVEKETDRLFKQSSMEQHTKSSSALVEGAELSQGVDKETDKLFKPSRSSPVELSAIFASLLVLSAMFGIRMRRRWLQRSALAITSDGIALELHSGTALPGSAAILNGGAHKPQDVSRRGGRCRSSSRSSALTVSYATGTSSHSPEFPEYKPNRPPGIDPSKFPDASTAQGVAQILEVTFVNAWPAWHVDTLKLFIAAAVMAYERGFTVNTLNLELSQCPMQTAGRPLQQEEVELRSRWLYLVYLTLARVQHPSEAPEAVGASVPAGFRQEFQTFVDGFVNSAQEGYLLESLRLNEDMLRARGRDSQGMAPREWVFLRQAMRVVFVTLLYISEYWE
jgi:hypothetical protein